MVLKQNEITAFSLLSNVSMRFAVMPSHCIPRPECFLAEVAGDGNSFQMVELNVSLHVQTYRLLSTRYTPIYWVTVVILGKGLLHH